MTLKQFFQLAGGLLAGFLFYSSPLLPIIKWPFVILSGILGVALAFLPLEERPLERWIFAFFKAIYSPTLFNWKKTEKMPKFFQDEPAPEQTQTPVPQNTALNDYLGRAIPKSGALGKLEEAEKGFLAALSGIFSGLSTQPAAAPATSTPAAPTPPAEEKGQTNIPQTIPVKITPTGAPHLVVEEKPLAPATGELPVSTTQVAPIIAGEEIISTKQAMFSVDAAPPNPPTVPNVVVGQVVDQERKIIEGAIIEIRDSAGRPIRAIRSNKVGHFITVTALDPGRYDILTEKDGYEFDPVGFEAMGQIIPPILVQGKKTITEQVVPVAAMPQPSVPTIQQ